MSTVYIVQTVGSRSVQCSTAVAQSTVICKEQLVYILTFGSLVLVCCSLHAVHSEPIKIIILYIQYYSKYRANYVVVPRKCACHAHLIGRGCSADCIIIVCIYMYMHVYRGIRTRGAGGGGAVQTVIQSEMGWGSSAVQQIRLLIYASRIRLTLKQLLVTLLPLYNTCRNYFGHF